MVRYYTDLNSESFHKDTYKKREFMENKYEKELIVNNEEELDKISQRLCSIKNSGVLNHQRLLRNFISPKTQYNSMLIYHATGTGKTCTAVSIAESYKEYMNNSNKKIKIICSSDIENEFRKTIINPNLKSFQCTGDTYLDVILNSEMNKESLINKAINTNYEFYTYGSFGKEISSLIKGYKESDVKKIIKSVYSDSIIIIDEAQNLRNHENVKKKISENLELVVENSENLKLILLSATPMYDKPSEIIWLINILLKTDKQKELNNILDNDGYLLKSGKIKLIESIKGRVSYLRGENPYMFPFKLYDPNHLRYNKYPINDLKGDRIDESKKITHFKLTQSIIQDKHYEKIMTIPLKDEFYSRQLQLHNICWHKKTNSVLQCIGINGLKSYFKAIYKKSNINNKKSNGILLKVPESFSLKTDYNPLNEMEKYSPKMKNIIDSVNNSNGIIFIYSKYVYSGIIPMALLLENNGYSKYTKHGGNSKILTSSVPKENKGKYAIITGNKNISGNINKLIEKINAPENKYGEEIKVILVSPIGGVGLSFKRIREIHILEPSFNMSDIEQTIGRGIRTCSHIDLPLKHRNCTIYYHVLDFNNGNESVDFHLYRNNELKQKPIDVLKNVIHENSFDCALLENSNYFNPNNFTNSIKIEDSKNNEINYIIGDTSDSSFCRFKDKCLPKCSYYPEKKIETDMDTYEPELHAASNIYIYMKQIIDLFYIQRYYHLNQITDFIQKKNNNNILNLNIVIALNKLITSRYEFSNIYKEFGNIIYDESNNIYVFSSKNKKYNGFISNLPSKYYKNTFELKIDDLNERVDSENVNISSVLNILDKKWKNIIDSEEIFNDSFWNIKQTWLKNEVGKVFVERLVNRIRIKILSENNKSFQNIYIEKAFKGYYKHMDKNTSYLSLMTTTDITYVELNTYKIFDVKLSKTKINFKELDIFGYTDIQREEGVFMISYSNNNKFNKGTRVENMSKVKLINILNGLYGFDKYISDKKNINVLKISNQLNAEYKTVTNIKLQIELELIIRYYDHIKKDNRKWYFSSLESYKTGLYDIVKKKK